MQLPARIRKLAERGAARKRKGGKSLIKFSWCAPAVPCSTLQCITVYYSTLLAPFQLWACSPGCCAACLPAAPLERALSLG